MDDRSRRRTSRAIAWLLLPACLGLLVSAGCVSMPTNFSFFQAAEEQVCYIDSWWDPDLHASQDTQHDGAEFLGMAGRVYFFNADRTRTLTPRGSVQVDWYDASGPPGSPRPWIYGLTYSPSALQMMKKKDVVGMGYTLFLDWPNYRPDYKRVEIRLRFIPEHGGTAIFASKPAVVTLCTNEPVPSSWQAPGPVTSTTTTDFYPGVLAPDSGVRDSSNSRKTTISYVPPVQPIPVQHP